MSGGCSGEKTEINKETLRPGVGIRQEAAAAVAAEAEGRWRTAWTT